MTIAWPDEQKGGHSCGWLLSEFLRRTESHEGSESKSELTTIALRSVGGKNITLDAYLTQVDRSLSLIEDEIELEAVQVPHREIAKLTTGTSQEETLQHYLIEKVIGKGGVSKVLLVRHKVTGLLYAMKVMRKEKIKKDNKVA